MRGWGWTLIILAAGSFLLNMIGIEFILLMWVDLWGPTIGIIIRIAIILIGLVMVFLGGREGESEE